MKHEEIPQKAPKLPTSEYHSDFEEESESGSESRSRSGSSSSGSIRGKTSPRTKDLSPPHTPTRPSQPSPVLSQPPSHPPGYFSDPELNDQSLDIAFHEYQVSPRPTLPLSRLLPPPPLPSPPLLPPPPFSSLLFPFSSLPFIYFLSGSVRSEPTASTLAKE